MIIEEVTAIENFMLLIKTSDGRTGVFDVKPYLHYEAFLSLNAVSEFKKVSNGGYFIEWECGADISADTIEAKMEITKHSGKLSFSTRESDSPDDS